MKLRLKNRRRHRIFIVTVFAVITLLYSINNTRNVNASTDYSFEVEKEIKILDDTITLKDDIIVIKEENEQQLIEEIKEEPQEEIVKSEVATTIVESSTAIGHRDLRVFEPATVEQINEWIDNQTIYNPDSPFKGKGEIFLKASEESGLDPRYILAHAALESGWGTSDLARTKHNYFGIAAYDHNPSAAFTMGEEMEAGIINGANWIAENYTEQGQHTLHLMIHGKKRYASDSNWIGKISSIMRGCN